MVHHRGSIWADARSANIASNKSARLTSLFCISMRNTDSLMLFISSSYAGRLCSSLSELNRLFTVFSQQKYLFVPV